MSTKTETTSNNTLNYDPKSKGIYSSLTGAGSNVLLNYMNNPLSNPWYNLGLGQSMKGANQLGQQNISALMNNMKISGIGGGSGNAFQNAMLSNIGRGNQSLRSQANMSNVFQALQRQMQATGMGMSFTPLLTGESGKQTTERSGLGTWLPQLMGAALGGASSFFGGGMGGGGGMPFNVGGAPSMSPSMMGIASSTPAGFGSINNVLNTPNPNWYPSFGGGR